ncbi:hypothetical protein ACLESO_12005 [Pyxidicoccus sp. 3LG]
MSLPEVIPSTPVPESPPSLVSASPPSPAPVTERWGLATRLAFRWAFIYLGLYNLMALVAHVPGGFDIIDHYNGLWEVFVLWVDAHFLGLGLTEFPLLSGDGLFNYVMALLQAVIAMGGMLVWSVADRRRGAYPRLHSGLRVHVRYVLITAMTSYGLAKIFKTQFLFPELEKLMMPLAEASPMGLVWRFMGYSTGYNLFTGGAELLGAVLLCFRRTTTLGALVVVGVMSNVVALNFFYDIPVKLYSSHLLLMAGFLLLPDLRRLADFLVFNRATSPVVLRTPFQAPWMAWGSRAVKVLFLGWCTYSMATEELELARTRGELKPWSELAGIYKVESFAWDGQEVPPLTTDTSRWKRVVFNRRHGAQLQLMDDTLKLYNVNLRPEEQSLTLSYRGGAEVPMILDYSRLDDGTLVLEGDFGDRSLRVLLTRVDTSKLLLQDRGFNWVTESPLNR